MPEFQNEQALLQQLRNSGDPACVRRADALQRLYHDRQLALLSADVYAAAKGEGAAPSGWIRVSEHPEWVQKIAARLHLSNDEFLDMLRPDTSGFRAEIYLPDPALLGPGYQPMVAFKGSTGEVLTANGLRDTTREDFLANNFPQSIGMETDYYDRAMRLARQLRRNDFHAEYTGHSLGGGLASAASAIGGEPATTFNAAGLHPLTAKRFAEQNGLPVYDVQQHVTAYHVQNELLNDGVQNNLHTLDEARRAQLGQVLGDAARLLHALPAVREPLLRKLNADLPDYAQATVNAFIDRLAAGDTAPMLRALPLAAGTPQPPLTAMAWGEYQPVPRQDAMTLQEVALLSKPLLEVVSQMEHGAERGAHLGRALGVAADDMLLGATLQAGGASFGVLPGPVTARMVDARLHQTPAQQAIDHHPTLTAATGAAGGLAAVLGAVHAQFNPGLLHLGRSLSNTVATRKVLSQGAAAGAEAADRHGMVTMLPSLEARIQETEWAARMALPRTVDAPAISPTMVPRSSAQVTTPQAGAAVTASPTHVTPQAGVPSSQQHADEAARAAQQASIDRQIAHWQRIAEEKEAAQRTAHVHTAQGHEAAPRSPEAVSPFSTAATAMWTPEPLPPPRVPATFANPDHPKHYRYQVLLEQVQEAPALQRYTADQHQRIAAGLTYVTDQHKAFVIQGLGSIEVKGSTLTVTDRLKIGEASEVLRGNLDTMLAKTPQETASAWREWALPKQAATAHAVASLDPQPISLTDMRHPHEPHHAMFRDVRQALGAAYAQHGMTRDPQQLDREAALVTVTLRDRQINEVPMLMLACEPDGRFSTHPGLRAVTEFTAVKLSGEALQQAPPVEQSSQALVQVEQRLHQQAIAFEQRLAQQAGLGRTR